MNNTLSFTTQCAVNGEKATMITESNIKLLESLANRAGKFEKIAPYWDRFKMGLSASISWTLFSLGCIVSIFIDDHEKLLTPKAFFVYLLFSIGIIGIITCWLMIYKEKELKTNIYDSHIDEIKEILQILRMQLRQDNNITKPHV